MPHSLPFALFGALLLLSSQALLAGAPIAMVTNLSGELKTKDQPIALLAELNEGTAVELQEHASLTLVYYQSGQEFKAQGPLQLLLKNEAPEANGKPLEGANLMQAAQSTKLAAAGHSQAAVIMRSPSTGPKDIELLYPAWSSILEPSPIFSWKIPSGQDKAYSYHLEILDNKGKVLFQGQSDIGRLRLPKTLELPRGERLTWELEAKRGQETLFGRADFQIADEALEQQTDNLSKELGQDFGRRIIFWRYLKANNFNHAANELWQGLVAERPELATATH